MSSDELVLCRLSDGRENDWSTLYESSFPEAERMSLAELQTRIADKSMLLHRTTDASGELICFSLVHVLSNFSLLCYIATVPARRSCGIGARHMSELLSILKAADEDRHLGLFLEIEATSHSSYTAAELTERRRRLVFYEKLGCRRLLGKDYFFPSYTSSAGACPGELLWFEYGDTAVDHATLSSVISEIFLVGYGVASDHPVYTRVLGQFSGSAPAQKSAPESNK